MEEVLPPRYDGEGLAAVLPAVARSLGVPGGAGASTGMDLPEARRAVVVLVDGLGYDLLRQRSGSGPSSQDSSLSRRSSPGTSTS